MARPTVVHDAFTAIADPTRRRMLDLLSARDLTVNQLAQSMPVSQPTISEHLKVLRNLGIVSVRKAGRQRIYSLEASGLAGVHRWLSQANGAGFSGNGNDIQRVVASDAWSPEVD